MNRKNRNELYGVIALILLMVVLSGCGNPPSTRFYALSSLATGDTRSVGDLVQARTVVGVGPISLAKYLEYPAITVRSGDNTLVRSEMNRWGGSLGDEVSRVLVENIGHLLSAEQYLVVPWLEPVGYDLRLQLIINRFEATSAQEVVFNGVWLLFAGDDNNPLVSGDLALIEPLEKGDYPAITAAMSRILAELSRLVVEHIRTAHR